MKEERQKKSLYLVGPLIAGSFFALGYGITHRAWVLLSGWKEVATEKFVISKHFPGKSLENFKIEFDKPSSNSKQYKSKDTSIINKRSTHIYANPSKVNNESILDPKNRAKNEPMFSEENFKKVFNKLTEY